MFKPFILAQFPLGRQAYREPRYVLTVLFLVCLALYLVMIPVPRVDGQLVGSDGVGYYIYVRSIVIDGDLDFADEYALYHGPSYTPGITPIGRIANKYAVGPAVLWAPFFLVAHLIALVGNALGLPVAPDGDNYLYQAAISIGSVVYGALGFTLSYVCASRLFAGAPALGATALLWLASNSFYYMVFEPSMSHMVSMFSVALALSIWFLKLRGSTSPSLRWAAAMGAASGLIALVRLQDALFLALPYGYVAGRCIEAARARNIQQLQRWVAAGLVGGMMTIVVFSPQMLVWYRLNGTWLRSPYATEHNPAFYWFQPQLVDVLFSTFHGLFSWHPVYLLATCGLLVVGMRDRWLALALAVVLSLDVYIVAAWYQWWQGDSFGGRMLLNAMWIWVIGLAGLLEWLRHRAALRRLALVVGGLLVVWNALSLIQYRLGFVPMGAPLTWHEMTLGRLEVLVRLLPGG